MSKEPAATGPSGGGASSDAEGERRSSEESGPGRPALVHIVLGQGLEGAKRFGKFLRDVRRDQGVSGRDIAQRAQISASYLRALETGKRAPSPDVAARVLRALGVPCHSAPDRSPEDVELSFSYHDQQWELDFKRWTGQSTRSRGSRRHRYLFEDVLEEEEAKRKEYFDRLREQDRTDMAASQSLAGQIVWRLPELDISSLHHLREFISVLATTDEYERAPLIDDLMAITPFGAPRTAQEKSERFMQDVIDRASKQERGSDEAGP